MNIDECLMRLRYGRFVWLAEQLYGKEVSASQICYSIALMSLL